MHKVLVYCLVKFAQVKVWLGERTRLDMTIAVDWGVKPQTKQTKAYDIKITSKSQFWLEEVNDLSLSKYNIIGVIT